MIILIYGTSQTGKTNLAQRLLEKLSYPYLSIDHLKMGLIRSNNTSLTVEDDEALTDYLWPIVKEIIKTAIENKQDLIIEGVYIPHNFKASFDEKYLKYIKSSCLIFSEHYIQKHFEDIVENRNVIEQRIGDSFISKEELIRENHINLKESIRYQNDYYLIEDKYEINLEAIND